MVMDCVRYQDCFLDIYIGIADGLTSVLRGAKLATIEFDMSNGTISSGPKK